MEAKPGMGRFYGIVTLILYWCFYLIALFESGGCKFVEKCYY
jgi:hypothetical protein